VSRIATLVLAAFVTLGLVLPVTVHAQDHYTYTVSALGGLGGSFGDDEGGFDNTSFSLGLSLLREDRVHVGVRLGQIEFASDDRVAGLADASLSYLVAGGEYRFVEDYYESGLFLGLGAYELEGDTLLGVQDSETEVGFVLGVTGEFEINRRLGFLVEVLGHVTSMQGNTAFGTGQVGLAVHF